KALQTMVCFLRGTFSAASRAFGAAAPPCADLRAFSGTRRMASRRAFFLGIGPLEFSFRLRRGSFASSQPLFYQTSNQNSSARRAWTSCAFPGLRKEKGQLRSQSVRKF